MLSQLRREVTRDHVLRAIQEYDQLGPDAFFAATNGFVDRILVDRVSAFLDGLTQRVRAEHDELRAKIAAGEWGDEIEAALRDAVAQWADDFGYDLDEEGQPLDPDAAPEPLSGPRHGAATETADREEVEAATA